MDNTNDRWRGKRVDNGEWVQGFYFNMHHNDERTHVHHFIIPLDTPIPKDKPIGEIQVEVNCDTLGRCTGLADRNGKLIYGGDILRYCMRDGSLSEWASTVKFGRYNCTCCDGVYGWYFDDGYGDIRDFESCEDAGPYVIVGNIYDNPEMMGGNDA